MNNTEDFCLEKRLEDLFEEVYMDTISDVQGDVTNLLKEFIRLLKEKIRLHEYNHKCNKKVIDVWSFIDIINNLAGSKLAGGDD